MCNRLLSWTLMLLLLAASAAAQVESGTISGTVRDASGAVIPNATVTARNTGTQVARSAQSNAQGTYTIVGLPAGMYEVTVTSGSFSPYKQNLQVTVGSRLTLDATLSVAASTTVEVTAQTAGVEVNTQTPEVSQIITPNQVAQLPSLTRNPYDFIGIAGNVSGGDRTNNSANLQTSGGGQNTTDRGVGFSINGQRASGTEVLLDGVENTNLFDTTVGLLVPQDAVQEFRVVTNNFDAQYGRASGGVINLTTKTGSNALHGSAWEFNRLSAYTANTYDNAANGLPKGKYTRNQFGYTIGGPVKKSKLFFFQSTEWLRVRSSASLAAYVPTPQLLAAMPANVQQFFNAYGANLPFVGVVTKGQSNASGNLINFTPGGPFDRAVPNSATPIFGLTNFSAPADAGGDFPQNTYNLVGRLDYNLTDKTQMFLRYGRENLLQFPGSLFNSPFANYNVGESVVNDSILYSLSHTFTPAFLSSTKISFSRDTVAQQFNTALQNTPTLFLYNSANIAGTPIQLPGFFDFTTGTGGLPFGGPQNVAQLTEDLAWTKGTHTMRFGGQFNYEQINRSYGAFAQAIQQLGKDMPTGLDALATGTLRNFQVAVDPQGKFPCVADATGALIASPGCTLTLPLNSPSFARSDRYRDWAMYAQDNWRVTPRFTLNYGLRYEYYGVQHNSNPNLDSNFYFGPGTDYFSQIRNGSVQIAANSPIGQLWNPNYGTVAPRLGFALDVFGNGTTSLRGGYGMTYERNFGNITFNLIQNPPNYATPQLRNTALVSVNNLGPLAGGSGTLLLPPSSPRHVDQNINTAQTQFWSMTLERQLGRRAVLALDYNGAHGVHLYDIKNSNELGGGQVYLGDPFVNGLLTRPNQQWTSINTRGSSAFSHYNGLNVRLQTQDIAGTGLSIVSNYTWSHSLDNLSSTFSESSSGANGVGNLGYLDPRNPALDYGNSDFDVRHRFVFSAIWNEPFFKNKSWAHHLLGGYSVVPIFTARTGTPFTVSDTTNSVNSVTGTGIPRYVPTGTITDFTANNENAVGPNAFNILTLPAANSFTGLLGVSDFGPFPANMTPRNAFRGPGAWNLDLALSKTFKVTERTSLEFRAEGFNLLNHHNLYVNGFSADVAQIADATGQILVQGKKGGLGNLANNGNHDERRFGQFALRVSF